ncbi:MAG TPA: class I SAM-dependent methyltransferase [Kofleriaceae bacterium]
MDSAKTLARYLEEISTGDLRIADIGGGPGHYYPVLRKAYTKGALRYTSVDIDVDCVRFGTEYYRDNPDVEFVLGSVLDADRFIPADTNCLISANTLPHIPSISSVLEVLSKRETLRYFVFRMLVGRECVQVRKHLRESDFSDMFEKNYQLNTIYSLQYMVQACGPRWSLQVLPDVFDTERLEQHRVPAQDADPFYANRVSRNVGGMVFKGEVYMPWKFVVGTRSS